MGGLEGVRIRLISDACQLPQSMKVEDRGERILKKTFAGIAHGGRVK